jgi:conjugative transfer signal peptidase TraF
MKRSIAMVTALGVGAMLHGMVAPARPRLVWNTTPSAPVGLYLVLSIPPRRGALLVVEPPPRLRRFLTSRGYLSPRSRLIKTLAAVPGDRVCRRHSAVWIQGHRVASAHLLDRHQRRLPAWHGCHILGATQAFLLGAAPDSLDSRYFGPIDARYIVGVALPIWTSSLP